MRDILIGTLVIDIADAKKKQVAWRGMGVKEVDTQAKPEKRDKSINNAVKKIFKNYPPEEELGGRDPSPDVMRRTAATLVLLAMSGRVGDRRPGPAALDARERDEIAQSQRYAELLRSDVRAEKVAILTEVMGFTEAEDKAFWPIYREYDSEMAELGDERVALIAEYARSYSTMTDAVAETLATGALDLEAERHAVKASLLRPRRKALSPRTACGSCRSSTSCS